MGANTYLLSSGKIVKGVENRLDSRLNLVRFVVILALQTAAMPPTYVQGGFLFQRRIWRTGAIATK